MRATIISTALLAPLATLAAPSSHHDKIKMNLSTRQNASLTKPAPCVPAVPAPSEAETEARFDKFANAFIVTKNITEAIEYITESYINHNLLAQNGSDSAWGLLSPIWADQNITVLGTKFIETQGWFNYESAFGTIVDQFRWEGGCIAEHWDQGEVFPEN